MQLNSSKYGRSIQQDDSIHLHQMSFVRRFPITSNTKALLQSLLKNSEVGMMAEFEASSILLRRISMHSGSYRLLKRNHPYFCKAYLVQSRCEVTFCCVLELGLVICDIFLGFLIVQVRLPGIVRKLLRDQVLLSKLFRGI